LEKSDRVDAVSSAEPWLRVGQRSSRAGLSSPAEDLSPEQRVSLVIPVRDEAETIQQLIDSIQQQSRKPDEVIFVDGGSRDGTIDILRESCKQNSNFRMIEARNALPGQGRNIGVANSFFDWIAFTDAGNRLEPDWLDQLITVANSDPETGIVCGNFDPVTDSFFAECASVAYLQNKVPRENGLVRGPFIASSLVRRDVWHAAGGFPDLRAAEDLIFFEEIERRGFKFKWAPKANVHWEVQSTLWKTFRRFFVYSCVNVWAGRQRYWHYGVARLYALGLPFLILAIWNGVWWLLVPFAALTVRVGRNVWLRREDHGLLWVLNPLRFACILGITLTLDLATFSGWIIAVLKRREARRIKNHMRTRRSD
jgi:cellulose synthase/poly-beta-1,6-N-acetylglucosamine synthase-like glycosyltransferase